MLLQLRVSRLNARMLALLGFAELAEAQILATFCIVIKKQHNRHVELMQPQCELSNPAAAQQQPTTKDMRSHESQLLRHQL
jgi:hypothetical protein